MKKIIFKFVLISLFINSPIFSQKLEFLKDFQKASELIDAKSIDAGIAEYENTIENCIELLKKLPESEWHNITGFLHDPIKKYAKWALFKHRFEKLDSYNRRLSEFSYGLRDDCSLSASSLEAHKALGNQDFDRAELIFTDLLNYANEFNNRAYQVRDIHPKQYLELTKKAKDLRSKKINPEIIYTVYSLRIKKFHFKWMDNETEYSTSRNVGLFDKDPELADIAENSLKQLVFALSNGKVDLEFEREEISNLQGYFKKKPKSMADIFAHISNLENENTINILQKIKEHDLVIVLWYGFQSSQLLGGAKSFKIDKTTFSRATMNIGTSAMYYQSPEYASTNAMGFFPHVYLHEFFHTVETKFKISPNHGFRKELRGHFPEWLDSDEVDFYKWQFDTTIPKKIETKGWKSFGWRDRSN